VSRINRQSLSLEDVNPEFSTPDGHVDHVGNENWRSVFPLSMAEKMRACQYRSFRSGRRTYRIQEMRSKNMPRTLVGQVGGEAMSSCEAVDATVEDGGVDQVVESKSHHQLADFL
jgi:hypothetical protein